MLLGPLSDVGVIDQTAEQRGHLWPNVQLFLARQDQMMVILGWMLLRCKEKITDLKQSQVPVVEVTPFATGIRTVEKRAVLVVIPMSC